MISWTQKSKAHGMKAQGKPVTEQGICALMIKAGTDGAFGVSLSRGGIIVAFKPVGFQFIRGQCCFCNLLYLIRIISRQENKSFDGSYAAGIHSSFRFYECYH